MLVIQLLLSFEAVSIYNFRPNLDHASKLYIPTRNIWIDFQILEMPEKYLLKLYFITFENIIKYKKSFILHV